MLRTTFPATAVALVLASSAAFAQEDFGSATAPFSLPELPYATDALEPAIDAETMELHHGMHHQSYVDTLNEAVEADPALADMTLDELVAAAGGLSDEVRNNAGGHWNHSFFWPLMAPEGEGGEPSKEFAGAIDAVFGSMDEFKSAFEEAGTGQFGSGWAWLIVDGNGELAITSTPDQDNPLMDVAEIQGTPILGNDVWEHAYYLTYNNRRAEYLSAWWDVVDWEQVSANYAEAVAAQ
ncbi:superoxide dismutase [Chelativorans sp. ZYF759]|uniref:superoxide dismutase n=1 Tax=Chelativorans sp. ZYF759 TaxID=2692213 RepID=UPI00145C750C|nr:superoxide dismutase [Chelativorans sp. ZYF759]NMG38490.1 superoxide dismutase [Chelativorans sp. ZYF759]